jgi:hypothetical protein
VFYEGEKPPGQIIRKFTRNAFQRRAVAQPDTASKGIAGADIAALAAAFLTPTGKAQARL